jgi:hypothetical protein
LRPVAAPRRAVRQLDVDDRDLLQLGMDDYFNNPDDPDFNVPVNLLEEVRILAGDQNLVAHPERRLSRQLHEQVINMLLNQNNYVEDITNLANNLENGNHFLMGGQAENLLNIITRWTERFPLNERQEDALVNVIRDMEPEQQFARLTELQADVLEQNMDDYFNNNLLVAPVDMVEPYATDMRILMGSQNPDATLSRMVHENVVTLLLDQDNHTADIRDLMNRLERGNYFVTGAQAENLLNILISWTERYPLNE